MPKKTPNVPEEGALRAWVIDEEAVERIKGENFGKVPITEAASTGRMISFEEHRQRKGYHPGDAVTDGGEF